MNRESESATTGSSNQWRIILLVLVAGYLMAPVGCGSNSGDPTQNNPTASSTTGANPTTEVALGIFSGSPDPSWSLTEDQAGRLAVALARLTRVDGAESPGGGLGYHGFSISTPDGLLVAFDGTVVSSGDARPYSLSDPDRTIERLLLDTARPHVDAEILAVVDKALG